MSHEHTPAPGEESRSRDIRDRWSDRRIYPRKTIKNLRDYFEKIDDDFPNRARILELVHELMNLVPPVSEFLENVDEQQRQPGYRGDLKL